MAAEINGSYSPVTESDAIPGFSSVPLAADAQVGRGQFSTIAPSTGHASLNGGNVPGQIAAGMGDPSNLSDKSAVAGAATLRLSYRWFKGVPASTVASDGFTAADMAVPFYIAGDSTPGKLSHNGSDDRSLGGLVFGLDEGNNPVCWSNPIAWLLARSAHQSDATLAGSYAIADGSASAATAERAIERNPVHGVVTAIEFIGAAVTANDTNNATITVSKRDGEGGAAVSLGTLTTNVAGGSVVAFTPKALTLSATAADLNLLETDVLTVTVAKAGSGASLVGNIRVIQKVI